MDTKLKISPHEIIFKTQKNIETSIPGFHSILFRSDFSPTNEPPCKITFRLFSIYDNIKMSTDSQPYIFNDFPQLFSLSRDRQKNPLCLFA